MISALSAVTLKSSVDGRCAISGEDVIYSCQVHNGITLQFCSAEFEEPIRFTASDESGFSASRARGLFQATLTGVNRTGSDELTANFTAQLRVTATMDLNGSLIECGSGRETENNTLLVSGKYRISSKNSAGFY